MKKNLTYMVPLSSLLLSLTLLPAAHQAVLAQDYTTPNLNTNGGPSAVSLQDLQMLLMQHASVGAQTFMARYDQSPNFDQLKQQVDQNTEDLSTVITNLYGQTVGGQFRNLWYYHIDLLTQYTDAKRANDQTTTDQKKQALTDFVNNLSTLLANANQNNNQNNNSTSQATSPVSQDQLKQMLQMHVDDEMAIIDAHASGNQSQVDSLMQQASDHMNTLATLIYQNSTYNNQNPNNNNTNDNDNDSDDNNTTVSQPNINGLYHSFMAHMNVLKNKGKHQTNNSNNQSTAPATDPDNDNDNDTNQPQNSTQTYQNNQSNTSQNPNQNTNQDNESLENQNGTSANENENTETTNQYGQYQQTNGYLQNMTDDSNQTNQNITNQNYSGNQSTTDNQSPNTNQTNTSGYLQNMSDN